MWIYNETPEFIDCSEKLRLSEKVRSSLKSWAVGVGRVQTNKTKHFFRSPNNIFEIWTARIPDPDSNKGSSSGFRLVYFINLVEGTIFLDFIEKRSELGGRREHPRDQRKFTKYLNDFKNYLLKELDS